MVRFSTALALLLSLAIVPAALGEAGHGGQSKGKPSKEKPPNPPTDTPATPPAPPAPAAPERGQPAGGYDLSVTGHYTGTGTATIAATVSFTATVQVGGAGDKGTLTATDLVINKDHFTGKGTIMGIECTIQGRIDLPSADDTEQTPKQAVTGRITGTFKDANGNVGRIVAVQKVAAPQTDSNNANNPDGGNDPDGNPGAADGPGGHPPHGKGHDGDKGSRPPTH